MTLHTCHNCGRERHATTLDLTDTDRGTLVVCRDTDEAGDCLTATRWRVVFRVANGGTGYDGVLRANSEREARDKAQACLGRGARAVFEMPRPIVWAQAQAWQGDDWVVCGDTHEAVTA